MLALEYFSQKELYKAVSEGNADIVDKLLSEVGLNHFYILDLLPNFTILSYRIQAHMYTTACLEGRGTTSQFTQLIYIERITQPLWYRGWGEGHNVMIEQ